MNVPNILTVSRFFMTCVFAVLASMPGFGMALAALLMFMLASFTDWADGYMARKYNLVTPFGTLMDPIADKCLTLTAFFVFACQGLLPLWAVVLIATREILVTMSRIQALTKGQVVAAEKSGKIKTVVQMVVIACALLYRTVMAHEQGALFLNSFDIYLRAGLFCFMMVAVVLTVSSGIEYFRNIKKVGS